MSSEALSDAQLRVIGYIDGGGKLIGLRPGANHFLEIEYKDSEFGFGLDCGGEEIADLLARGIIRAIELPKAEETDDGLFCTHYYETTKGAS